MLEKGDPVCSSRGNEEIANFDEEKEDLDSSSIPYNMT